MQTRGMKREYEVAVLDPAGNVTAIVLSDVQAAERARIAAQLLRLPELRIEQAAFLTAPRCGGEIRLEMMGGEFCGNALRCAGFYHALRTGAQGKTCVLAEISGAEGVQPVMADTAAGGASTVMPLPRAVQPADWPDVQAVRVTFDGITHFVMDRAQPDDALVQRAIAAAPEDMDIIYADAAHDYAGPGYNVPDAKTRGAVELLARTEGIFLDPCYTAKSFRGFCDIARELDGGAIFVHTGGTPALWTQEHLDAFAADYWN